MKSAGPIFPLFNRVVVLLISSGMLVGIVVVLATPKRRNDLALVDGLLLVLFAVVACGGIWLSLFWRNRSKRELEEEEAFPDSQRPEIPDTALACRYSTLTGSATVYLDANTGKIHFRNCHGLVGTDDFGFSIQDNGIPFTSIATGCNQVSAAALLDQLRSSGTPPAAIAPLRNGSTAEALLAYDQLSGSIYPSLIGAEINHVQNNLESVRDRVALQFISQPGEPIWTPWVRAYGVSGEVGRDDCQTLGYRHEVGGVELGCGLSSSGALAAYTFAHLATANLYTRGVDQHADIDSYRMGGLVEYLGRHAYVIVAGGAGTQDYEVRRSLTAFEGSSFAESSFDGSAQFGYFELGSGDLFPWTPYVALHATRVDLDSITETGDADFALLNNGGVGDSLRGVLGLALVQSGVTPIGIATTRLRVGWLHEYLDASETFISQVANGGTPTGPLIDRGVDPGIDFGFVRMQVDLGMLLGGQFTVAYEGQYNSDSSYNALLGGIRWVH